MFITDRQLVINDEHMIRGFIIIQAPKCTEETKISVQQNQHLIYYSIPHDQNTTIPLQYGCGIYIITLYKKKIYKTFTEIGRIRLNATSIEPNGYMLESNQYVNFSSTLFQDLCICSREETPEYKFEAISKYIRLQFSYDFIRAFTIKKGALPDIPYCMKRHSGICQDLAALATALFRYYGLPARLMIGYADKSYHAWVEVLINNQYKIYDPTAEIRGKKVKTYKNERWY